MKKLNFGCGIDKREGYDNIDIEDFDFNEFPYMIANNIYDEILVRDVLEHMKYPIKTLEELHRICKPNGVIKIITPYYNSAGSFGSMEHYHHFNKNCFAVWDKDWKGNICSNKKFIVTVRLIPTKLGKCIPSFIREKASFVIGEIYNSIEAEMRPYK
jgi:predicted SAM-dependent methyltransferase